jgi:hypothetical protein
MYRIIIISFFVFSTIQSIAQFTDITTELGVQHTFVNTAFLGGGAVSIDVNNDGWEDLVFTGGSTPDKMYLNLGNGEFEEVEFTNNRYDSQRDTTSAVVSGDLNNDGCEDLLFTNYSQNGYDLILRNDCNGNFDLLPIDQALSTPINSMGATLFDFNNDGLLDIFSLGYVERIRFQQDDDGVTTGFDHDCEGNRLYLNRGNFDFEDVTDSLNIAGEGCGLAVTVVPIPDRPGEYGILVANDFGPFIHPNEFFVPDDNGIYEEVAEDYGLDIEMYGMGIGIGDLNRDQRLDLYITNLGENFLMLNKSDVYEVAQNQFGVANAITPDGFLTTGWGTFFIDVERDTDLDLLVANGTVSSPEFIAGSFNDPNILMFNNGADQPFTTASAQSGISFTGPNINRGAIKSDIDNDGDLDVIVSYINFVPTDEPTRSYRIYRNDFEGGNYIALDLVSNLHAADAFGSEVSLFIDGEEFIDYKFSGGTHASQNTKFMHFGLADATIVDSIEVRWRSGMVTKYDNVPANQFVRLFDDSNEFFVLGCTDSSSSNFNPNADLDFGCSTERSTSVFNIPDVECRDRHVCPEIFERVESLVIYDILGRNIGNIEPDQFLSEPMSSLLPNTGLHVIVGFDSKQLPIYSEKVFALD